VKFLLKWTVVLERSCEKFAYDLTENILSEELFFFWSLDKTHWNAGL
jgi:hypothetical protein